MHFPTRILGFPLGSKSSQRTNQPVVAYAQVAYRRALSLPQPSTVLLSSPPPLPAALPTSTFLVPSQPPPSTLFIPPPLPPPPQPTIPITLLLQPAPPARSPSLPLTREEPEQAVREFCTSPTEIRIEHEEIEEIPTETTWRGHIWQTALGINLLLLLGAAIGIPFIVMNAWPSTTTTSTVDLPSQCASYTTITDNTRYYTYTGSTTGCDNPTPFGSASTWVRFSGGQGTMLATSVIPSNQCGTTNTGYYTGSLPTVATTVTGTVCYNSGVNTCVDSNTISISNCSGYYIYLLTETPSCNERYCTV